MNNQHVTLFVLLDLSEAFDKVDHGILLEAFNNSSWNLEAECLSGFDLIFQGAVNGYRFVVVSLRVLTSSSRFLSWTTHCLPSIRAHYEMSFKIIFHSFIVTVMTTKFMSPLVLQMRQVIQMLLLLSRVLFRLSGTGCMYDNKLLLNAWRGFLLIGTKQQLAIALLCLL